MEWHRFSIAGGAATLAGVLSITLAGVRVGAVTLLALGFALSLTGVLRGLEARRER